MDIEELAKRLEKEARQKCEMFPALPLGITTEKRAADALRAQQREIDRLRERLTENRLERNTAMTEVARLRAAIPLDRIRAELELQEHQSRGKTHWEGCEDVHPWCRVNRLLRDILRAVEGDR